MRKEEKCLVSWVCRILPFFFLFSPFCLLPVSAQDKLDNSNQMVPTVNKFSYNVQKYTGFNLITDVLVESVIRSLIKHKAHPENIDVDLKIYSGWDLIQKKAKF